METIGIDTFSSLIGIKPLIDDILVKVTDPLRNNMWDQECVSSSLLPKFILITGRPGCGKRALCEAIINELRRAPWRKSADVFYKDKKVKFLAWFDTPWDMELNEYLTHILSNARLRKDGRDFTVIYFRRFEMACPAEGRSTTQEQFIQAMKNELLSSLPGLFLVVAATSFPEQVDPEILKLVDFNYDIPEFDKITKKSVLRNLFEAEHADISEENVDLIMEKIGSRAIKCLKIVALEACETARSRLTHIIQPDELCGTRVFIERRDLPDVVLREEGE